MDSRFKFRLYLDTKDVRDGNYLMIACSWRGNRYKYSSNIHLTKNEQVYFLANNKVIDFATNNIIFATKISKEDQQLNVHLKLKKYANDLFNQYSALKKFFDKKDSNEQLVTADELRAFVRAYKAIPIKKISDNFIERYKLFLQSKKAGIKKTTFDRMSNLIYLIEKHNPKIDIHYFNNLKNVNLFYEYLLENNYNNSTIKLVFFTYIKQFMTYLFDAKEIKSNDFLKHFKEKAKNLKRAETDIVLSSAEIELIVNAQLPEHLIYSRQLMLVQYYTALRISDLMKLKSAQIDLKNNVIKIYQQKTNNYLMLPIHHKLKPILEDLNGVFLPIPTKNYNSSLKTICKIAGINQLIEVVTFSGNERKSKSIEKWEVISSHTLRRTAITHGLQRGLLPEEMMHISGHKNRASFDKYVKISREQAFTNFLNKF